MSRIGFTALAAAAFLAAAPAVAQSSMGSDNSMGSSSMGSSMTCQQMMDKANSSMGSMTDDSKKQMAMGEMDKAKASMAAHHESNCKMHMNKVMGMM
jgi:hypothetical protein